MRSLGVGTAGVAVPLSVLFLLLPRTISAAPLDFPYVLGFGGRAPVVRRSMDPLMGGSMGKRAMDMLNGDSLGKRTYMDPLSGGSMGKRGGNPYLNPLGRGALGKRLAFNPFLAFREGGLARGAFFKQDPYLDPLGSGTLGKRGTLFGDPFSSIALGKRGGGRYRFAGLMGPNHYYQG